MASRLALGLSVLLLTACAAAAGPGDEFAAARRRMVREQVQARGVADRGVLSAMEQVPRHAFVPESVRERAYADAPLPIGSGQTISQPYVVGLMTHLLDVQRGDRVLEIGTGSGYQAAVLSKLAAEVYSIEIVEPLAEQARGTLEKLGYANVHLRVGDGYQGWPEAAPFDGILLTAAPPEVPAPLLQQLAVGGRLVAPVGGFWQDLVVYTRQPDGSFHKEKVLPVRFVPMTGEVRNRPPA